MRDSILLIAAAVLAFGLSLGGSFHFDDYSLFENAGVTSLTATRPITNLTFQLNEALGGRNPVGYHVVNLLLHVVCVVMVWRVLGRMLPAGTAFVAALMFAVHPVQTEPVNYIFERATILATLFCVVSLGAWLDGRRWIAVAWFAAALLSKEEVVAFPAVLALLNWAGARGRREWPAIGAMAALCVAAGLRVIAATAAIQGTATGFGAAVSPVEYLSIQGLAMLRYARLVMVPWGITIDPELPAVGLGVRLAAWAVVVAGVAWAACRSKGMRAGFWFVAAFVLLLPSSSVFPVNDFAADRRMYLPMVAVSAGVAVAVLGRWKRPVALAVLAAYGAVSVYYAGVWQSERRLWSAAVELAPGKARPRLQLARAMGSPEEALAVLADAERIAPGDPAIASEQGKQLLVLKRVPEALAAFGRALAAAPGDAMNVSNRAAALLLLDQREVARQEFERALRIDPCQLNARLNLRNLGVSTSRPPANCRYTAEQRAQLGL